MHVNKKLELLRKEMSKHNIDIYIIPSIDAHNSEYVPECFNRRSFISNFDGSAGEVVVTQNQAYLWTDGRYYLQANNQLDLNFYKLMKQTGDYPTVESWLTKNINNQVIGVDPSVFSINRINNIKNILLNNNNHLKLIKENLVDLCKKNISNLIKPQSKVLLLDEKYTGLSRNSKIEWLQDELIENKVHYIILNALDEIAWLLNIRGIDIDYNPLLISFLIVSTDDLILFADLNKFSELDIEILQQNKIKIFAYEKFYEYLANLNGTVWLDDKIINYAIYDILIKNSKIYFKSSPIILAKACKNQIEQDGAKIAHINDAVAVISFINWLEKNYKNQVDEISAADKLFEFRRKNKSLKGLSFPSISGFAANGAIIHYCADENSKKIIDDTNLYLIDSGGQYLEGTTDVTRTLHFGTPSLEQKKHYTLVLKGHLTLGRSIFPHGTCGEHLDALARMPLWQENLNYRHGTGHGVGSFLCVHEGPQRISPGISNVPLLPGMIISNEPGFYLDNQYGIRIENLCLVKEVLESNELDYGQFYKFDDLTLVPYAKNLIDLNLLNSEDIKQIRIYYNKINTTIRPHLNHDEQIWLDNELDIFNDKN